MSGYRIVFDGESEAWEFAFGETPREDVFFGKPEGVEIYRKSVVEETGRGTELPERKDSQ